MDWVIYYNEDLDDVGSQRKSSDIVFIKLNCFADSSRGGTADGRGSLNYGVVWVLRIYGSSNLKRKVDLLDRA